jgi:hypothetical protein
LNAILPGELVKIAVADSLNKSWSMPKFLPSIYSQKARNPITKTTKAQRRAIPRAVRLPCHLVCDSHSDKPIKIKPIAVFAFIVTKLGEMLFRTGISRIQPSNTTEPLRNIQMLNWKALEN